MALAAHTELSKHFRQREWKKYGMQSFLISLHSSQQWYLLALKMLNPLTTDRVIVALEIYRLYMYSTQCLLDIPVFEVVSGEGGGEVQGRVCRGEGEGACEEVEGRA